MENHIFIYLELGYESILIEFKREVFSYLHCKLKVNGDVNDNITNEDINLK